jgi:hypothetical protein
MGKRNSVAKEESETLHFRIGKSFINRIAAMGKRSTVAAAILKRFLYVCELSKVAEAEPNLEGDVVYLTHFRDNLYHLTSKGSGGVITIELTSEALAQHLTKAADLINLNYSKV